MDPDWDDLRVFLAVVRAESLSGAGRALRLDPATVGRRVARLEDRLGAALFAKSPQGYALTGAGQGLVAHAERAEQAVTAARDEVRGATEGLSGQVRIGAPDGCATYVLPQVVAAIAAENPALEMQIVALPRIFNLSRREADMAIAVSRPAAGRLMVHEITDYRLHLAAHERYLAGAPPLERLADLRAHRIVGYIPDMIFDKELDYLAETGAGAAVLASNAVPVQVNLLRAGAGVGIVHDFALPAVPGLRRVLADAFCLTRAFHLIRHADDRRVARLNRVAAALAEGVRREVLRLEALAAAESVPLQPVREA